jgi:hypothetical protein
MRFLTAFRLFLLGLWLGAAVFFVVMAQNAFAVIPARETAGVLVSRTLAILNYSGLGAAFVLILTSLIVPFGTRKVTLWLERLLLVVFGAGCAVGQFVISWYMLLLKTQMGRPVDEVAADDPLRIQFNDLHNYSEWVLITATACALLAFIVISLRRPIVAKSTGFGDLDLQK